MDRRALETLTTVLDNLRDAIWSFDLIKQQYIYANRRFNEMYGASPDQLLAEPFKWRTTVHPEDYAFVNRETQRLYHGESVELEFRIVVNGQIRWVSDRKSPVFDSGGKLFAVVGITTDITDKKHAELVLKDSEYTYRYLFLNNPNPLWIYDRETLAFMAVNNAAISEYGFTEEEFLSMKITEIRPEEEVPRLLSSIVGVKGVHSRTKGWKHRTKNGKLLDVIISGHGIVYNGRECEIIMVHNVTEMMRAREEVIIAKTNLDASINNINNLIWSVDSEYRILSMNTVFKRQIKASYNLELSAGDSILLEALDPEQIKKWKTLYDKTLAGEVIVFNTSVIGLKNTYEIKMNPIYHDDKIIGVVSQGRDIQDALNEAIRAQKQNEELRQIVELASHDIRGPVASLMGIVPLFNESQPDDPFNADIINHVRTLATQLDDILHKIVDKSYLLQQENDLTDVSPQSRSGNE
ncbi:PAS domain S-box protein [Arcticibacter sp.]|jgi:PAS domain S-box-containing protein|uniref:PAS domain-containing protein n=1 Tax=Arcticibacter sp. TaxID=1872630 RepID=UPI003890527B